MSANAYSSERVARQLPVFVIRFYYLLLGGLTGFNSDFSGLWPPVAGDAPGLYPLLAGT
ncbi:hypothetical protein [Neptuniibacter pectenicola]|uniref:hypothetical protein n=1 Tax=Neptuniibacter pectenicola TaxID=1806669 RepID=UPI0030ED4874